MVVGVLHRRQAKPLSVLLGDFIGWVEWSKGREAQHSESDLIPKFVMGFYHEAQHRC